MNFVTTKLGDIATTDRTIVSPESAEAKRRPYLGLEQIEAQTGRVLSYLTDSVEGKSTTFAFDPRHVLYGKLRPYLNKVAEPEFDGRCSTEIIPLLPNRVDREFLALLLRSDVVVAAAMSDKTGSRMPRADMDALLELEVVVPESIKDQRRIAAHLKSQLAAVEEARNAAQAQLKDAQLLVSRIREQSFEAFNEAKCVPLGELLLGIESGKSFQTSDRLATEHELGVLKLSAVSWSEFRPNEAKAIDGDYMPDVRHYVKQGDILISRANTVELVGAVVRAERDYPNRLLSDKTLRLRLNKSRIHPDFLLQVLRMPQAREHIEANATGTSDSMRNISQGTIRAIPVPLLDMNLQIALAQRLNHADAELRVLMQASQAQLQNIELLPARLLAAAFNETEYA